jgi:type IV pilus assembly protein PilC
MAGPTWSGSTEHNKHSMIDKGNQLRGEDVTTLVHAVGAAAGGRIPLEVTLAALGEERQDRRLAAVAQRLAGELSQGVPIDEALAAMERHLPQEVRGLLRAGIESGDLAGTFERYADQRLASQRMRRGIQAAVAYPLIIIAILVPLALFISMYVIPMFGDIYEEFELDLPIATEWILQTARQVPGTILGLMIFVIGVPLVLRIVGGRWMFHRVRSAVPLFGRMWLWSGQRDFAAMLASFLDLRLPLPDAVGHTGEVMRDRNVGAGCRRVRERLQSGESLFASLAQSIYFDRSLVALVGWGERHGLLAEALRIATEIFDDRIEQRALLIQRLLPPVTLIAVATLTFFTIIGLMLPLVKLIEMLSM